MAVRKISRTRRALGTLGLVASLALLGATGLGLITRAQLPAIYSLADYRPIEASELFAEDGELLMVWAEERRTAVPFAALPTHVVHAFLAAEDAGFYEHEGIDWWGVARALVKNMRPGAHLQGASTITQQTVKTLVLGPERSLWRKVREAVLARRLEQLLGKDEILTLYLNQIYFGAGAWGIEQAARVYFGKSVRDVDLGQAALLAGIPKSPARYTLIGDRIAARERQLWVLGQMVSHGWATPEQLAQVKQTPLPPMAPPPPSLSAAPHFAELVRRRLVAELGDARLLTGGLKIYTPLKLGFQEAANVALRQGARDVARRQGFSGARLRVAVDELGRTLAQWHRALGTLVAEQPVPVGQKPLWGISVKATSISTPESLASARSQLSLVELLPYTRVVAPVVHFDTSKHVATLDLGESRGLLAVDDMAWAQPNLKDPSEILRVGDLIDVEVLPGRRQNLSQHAEAAAPAVRVGLLPDPHFEGALVAIDPRDHTVRALVGGLTDDGQGFNHATQAQRQLGSAFKPVLYAAGIEGHVITPATLCNDAPVVIPDPSTGKTWKPENYEDGRYDGLLTFRQALSRSKNTCSVRLLEKIGIEPVSALALAMGLSTPIPNNLTSALGTGVATPWELTRAYAVLAAAGQDASPRLIYRVVDRQGQPIAPFVDAAAPTAQVISAEAAAIVTSMMTSVITQGTGHRAAQLNRPLAGKTGTSQMSRDVWFAGFAPQLVAGVWLGHDDNGPLGRETGASAALPVWIRFMGAALAGTDPENFVIPETVAQVLIDPRTGEPSAPPASGQAELFMPGTEPHSTAQPARSIFMEDDEPMP